MFLENTLKYNKQFGWIEVICGSMFSGKTEELIRRLKRAKLTAPTMPFFFLLLASFANRLLCSPGTRTAIVGNPKSGFCPPHPFSKDSYDRCCLVVQQGCGERNAMF